jgi:Peptidase family M23
MACSGIENNVWRITLKRLLLVCTTFLPLVLGTPAHAFLNYKSPYKAGVIDWIRQSPEGDRMDPGTKFLSGSVLRQGGKDVNVPVPCTTKKCQHIEFVNIPGVPDFVDAAGSLLGTVTKQDNPLSVLGNRWEVGPDHLVKGGFGFLAVGPLGQEPSGRLVVQGPDGPAAIKIVLISINEQRGTLLFQGYGRHCVKVKFKGWVSCTAFVNPLPMFILITRGSTMPVDIKISGNMPNPLPLSPKALAAQASFVSKLKQSALSQGLSIGTGLVGSAGSGGGTQSSPPSAPPQSTTSPSNQNGYQQVNNTPVVFNGQTMPPVQDRTISSGYGWRMHPIKGTLKFHDGIDFPVPIGTSVMAIASGRIIYQGWLDGYGKTVVIDHGGGYSSLYGHLSGFIGRNNGFVPMGAAIGLSGSTGQSTGPHLHLNVRAGGDGRSITSGHDIDPRTFIRGL